MMSVSPLSFWSVGEFRTARLWLFAGQRSLPDNVSQEKSLTPRAQHTEA